MKARVLPVLLLLLPASVAAGFAVRSIECGVLLPKSRYPPWRQREPHQIQRCLGSLSASSSSSTLSTQGTFSEMEASVAQLKIVLEREYLSFFDPMERDYYAPTVTFQDPLTTLSGIDGYQNNVDMLAGRTLLGSLLFQDASIILHSVTGGQVLRQQPAVESSNNNEDAAKIADIVTRWTLRFTFKILPWRPTARFSGISVYSVVAGGAKGVQIVQQLDYWDAINLQHVSNKSATINGADSYQAVDRSVAVSHFLDQLKPGQLEAVAAGPELPYTTLRLGAGYEVRRYPTVRAAQVRYERRDEAFSAMGSFTSGMKPLAPAFMNVHADGTKTMLWPLDYCAPGQTLPAVSDLAASRGKADSDFDIVTVPSRVVAVRIFGDALVEPVVRRVDKELRDILHRDGLIAAATGGGKPDGNSLQFAQYDAVYSMGKRRSEVHIPLEDGGHPW